MRIIRGKYGRRRFDVPTNISARPTTDFARENIFNVLDNLIDFDGLRALDLFAGTGAITFELLSRGCEEVTAVEKANTQYQFIRKVAGMLDVHNLRLIRGDVFKFLESSAKPFDFVFADPPYDMPDFETVPQRILDSSLTAPGTLIVVEHSRKHDFSQLPGYFEHREYGSVNFSLFRKPGAVAEE